MTPKNALAAYIFICIIFVVGTFLSLYSNLKFQFTEIDEGIENSRILVLDQNLKEETLCHLLNTNGYASDEKDATLISKSIVAYLNSHGTIPNLGTLMKPEMKILADTAYEKGGRGLKMRVEKDWHNLGVDCVEHKKSLPSIDISKDSTAEIVVSVTTALEDTMSVTNIPIRIKEHYYITTNDSGKLARDSIVGYVCTDTSGVARIALHKNRHYSVIPVRRGYQYGREKGTTKEEGLHGTLSISFKQNPHVLTLFSFQEFSNIKQDKTLIVRTPAQFKDALTIATLAFIFGWGLFLLYVLWLDKRQNTHADYLLIITLMTITGIGLLASYSIWNPLIDTLYGKVMTNGMMIGLIVMAALMTVNYAKLDATLRSQKWFIFREYGWTCLVGAIGLLGMLYLFGSGPEGSDAKVNLFGFQPSEIARIFILIFIAWFFARNASLLQDFSGVLTQQTFRRQVAIISGIIVSMLGLMVIYILLSDMGPALVVLISFIMIYSMARRDFAQLLLGLLSFIILMFGARWWNNSLPTMLSAATLWFVGWIAFWYWKKHQIYESAIFLNFVIVVFSLAGPILEARGLESLAARLTNRTNMAWEGVWNNEVPGGDQVAQGLWSLASGGWTGMGLGNGSPAVVPACHTDMIFTTIGEMLGLVGLLLVVLCFFVIIHRTILIGRRAGYTFPFYLATGFGIVTGVQFLVIVAGSLGLLPLTGITLPFLSYGRVSLIASLVSFGFVISISRLRATAVQKAYTNSFNGSIIACSGLFLLVSAIILITAMRYQIFSRGATLIRPAEVTNMEGARIIEYNPRIALILRKMNMGNIYDRNGMLLATSSIQELEQAKSKSALAEVEDSVYKYEHSKRKRRYYPYGNHLLFMLGDYNTLNVFGYTEKSPIGYLAEARHQGELRGLEIPSAKDELDANKYRGSRFLNPIERKFTARKYDYSNFLKAGFLDYGIEHNPIVEKYNNSRKNRDLHLTIDAQLQVSMQKALAESIPQNNQLKNKKSLRASVVVLDAMQGDLLCSANYPLPNQDSIKMLNDYKIYGNVPFERLRTYNPITERDLGLTFQSSPGSTAKVMSAMAGFIQLGEDAGKIQYDIHGDANKKHDERIEKGDNEPQGLVSMEEAIEKSSNCYFINLVHDKELYPALDTIYSYTGVRVNPDSKIAKGNITPYFFERDEFIQHKRDDFDQLMTALGNKAVNKYRSYLPDRKIGNYQKMKWGETQAAWGQGPVLATPLNMARVVSIVANHGQFIPTRYVLQHGTKNIDSNRPTAIISSASAAKLKMYMQKETAKHRKNGKNLPQSMGGKTGTPERVRDNKKINDAWYICFVDATYSPRSYPKDKEKPMPKNVTLAIAVRLERTEGENSGTAVTLVAKTVVDALVHAGYTVK